MQFSEDPQLDVVRETCGIKKKASTSTSMRARAGKRKGQLMGREPIMTRLTKQMGRPPVPFLQLQTRSGRSRQIIKNLKQLNSVIPTQQYIKYLQKETKLSVVDTVLRFPYNYARICARAGRYGIAS